MFLVEQVPLKHIMFSWVVHQNYSITIENNITMSWEELNIFQERYSKGNKVILLESIQQYGLSSKTSYKGKEQYICSERIYTLVLAFESPWEGLLQIINSHTAHTAEGVWSWMAPLQPLSPLSLTSLPFR